MKDLLVIGVGNTLRGDDGAGVRAVERVRAVPDAPDCLTVHQLTPELADAIRDYARVCFVDASVAVDRLACRGIEPESTRPGSHTATPGGLLAMARDLYGQAPAQAWLVEIPACVFEFGEEMSVAAEAGVTEAVGRVRALQVLSEASA